jgi:hypothetical protein
MWITTHKVTVINMGKMNVVLSDELENKFRKTVYESKGYKKGNISEAMEEAIECWIKKIHEEERERK